MRIVFTTLGTTGDIMPKVALAVELRRHGHECIFALPWNLLHFSQQRGFETHQLGPNLEDVFEPFQRAYSKAEESPKAEAAWNQALLAAAPQALEQLQLLCQGADLLVSSYGMDLGRIVHELTSIPFASMRVCYPSTMTIDASDIPLDDPINLFRAQLGLPAMNRELHGYSPQLALFGISPEMLPRQPDWPSHFHSTGFLFLDSEDEWQPSPGLEAFLNTGPAPVLITLGSTMWDDPVSYTELLGFDRK